MIQVTCLDDGRKYLFIARAPYEAMKKMMYYLNIKHKEETVINKTKSGFHLWMQYGEKTYVVQLK